MRHRITREMLQERANQISENILGHIHSYAMGGWTVGTYENIVYQEPGSTGEWSKIDGESKREVYGKASAMLDGFYEKRKADKAVFVPIIAELWCSSHYAERRVSKCSPYHFDRGILEESLRAAGDAGGRLAATMLTLRRIYGESEIDSWYREAMGKRECLQGGRLQDTP